MKEKEETSHLVEAVVDALSCKQGLVINCDPKI